jgi:hypothetical protein
LEGKLEVAKGFTEWIGASTLLGIGYAMIAGMDNSVNKASVSLLAMATLLIAAIAAKIRATAEAQAPEGYEDASGFHFGSPQSKG